MGNQSIYKIIKNNPLIPVVTFQKDDDPIAFMKYLLEQNVFCIEITLRTEYGIKAIKALKNEYSDTIQVGAGTVTNALQIKELKAAGVDFMVSPGLTDLIHKELSDSGIPFLPGVSTTSEIMKAREWGLRYLKFFPAELYGGTKALEVFQGLFPELHFCPTGGINQVLSKEYLKLNNVIAVGGSWFQKEFNKKKKR